MGNRAAAAHAQRRHAGIAQLGAETLGRLLVGLVGQPTAGRDLDAVESSLADQLQVAGTQLARWHLAEGIALARVIDAATERIAQLHASLSIPWYWPSSHRPD